MNFRNALEPGDRLRIADEGREYGGVIGWAADGVNFTVLQPRSCAGRSMPETGREYSITCAKQNGIHRFCARLLRSEHGEKTAIHHFAYTGGYVRVQRRDAFRRPMALNVKFRKIPPDGAEPEETPWMLTKTVNVSEGGMCLELDGRFVPGDRIECALHTTAWGTDVILPMVVGEIVWTRGLPGRRRILAGVEFTRIDRKHRDVLLKLIALEQVRNLSR